MEVSIELSGKSDEEITSSDVLVLLLKLQGPLDVIQDDLKVKFRRLDWL